MQEPKSPIQSVVNKVPTSRCEKSGLIAIKVPKVRTNELSASTFKASMNRSPLMNYITFTYLLDTPPYRAQLATVDCGSEYRTFLRVYASQ